jgi:hypothetical protein
MGVDISRALRAPFNDPEWIKKTLLGWLWILLFFTSPAVYGAMIEYIQGVARGDDRLPEWDDFGGKWVRGLLVSVAAFIYFLPIIVIGMIMVVPLALSANSSLDSLTGLLAGGMCLFWVVAMIYGIAVSILFYAAITNYAIKGHFGAFFEVGEILEKVRMPNGGYFTAWLYALLVSIVGSALTGALGATWIGAILFGAILYLQAMITAHLFGQWATGAFGVAPAYAPPGYAPTGALAPPTPPASAAPPASPAPPVPPAPGIGQPAQPAAPAYQPPAAPVAVPPAPPVPPVAPPAPVAAPPVAPPAPEPPVPAAPPAPEPPAPGAPSVADTSQGSEGETGTTSEPPAS